MKDLPIFCPLIYIIDPQDKPKKLSKSANLLGLLEASQELNNFYYRKHRPDYIWYGEAFEEQFRTFVESYFDGTTRMNFATQERKYENSLVKHIVSDDFLAKVVHQEHSQNLTPIKHAIVEVYKKDCEACHYNSIMFDTFSQKMKKHGLLDEMPLFRMDLDNLNPYLGRFLYAPQYVYVRSREG